MEKLIEELNIVSEVSDQESKNSDTLETLSQTVVLVPNVNKNDNIIQGGVVGGGALLTTIITYAMTGDTTQALIGSLGALIVLGLFSGLILMVVGWVRTLRKVKKWHSGCSTFPLQYITNTQILLLSTGITLVLLQKIN